MELGGDFSIAARKHETLHTHPINPALGGESSRGEEGPRTEGGMIGVCVCVSVCV